MIEFLRNWVVKLGSSMLEDKRNSVSAGNDPERTPGVDTDGGASVSGGVVTGGGHFIGWDLITEGAKYDDFALPKPNLGLHRFSNRTSYQAGAMVPIMTLSAMSLIDHRHKNHKT
jgi:hypothetical protein